MWASVISSLFATRVDSPPQLRHPYVLPLFPSSLARWPVAIYRVRVHSEVEMGVEMEVGEYKPPLMQHMRVVAGCLL